MPQLTPKYVYCPNCHRKFTNRGLANHLNKCKGGKTTRKIRDLNK
jgi:hypothetical protein